jgi:hypothetical protein
VVRAYLASREVFVHGVPVETTAKEFDLLAFLAASPGRVFTRHQLLREVWHSSAEWQQEGTVTEHVRRLLARVAFAIGVGAFRTRDRGFDGAGIRGERGSAEQQQ